MKKEIRLAELRMAIPTQEAIDSNEMIVEGYALVFESPTVMFEQDGIQYKEIIQRGALDNCDLNDVPFRYNHSNEVMIMARTRNKTLQLMVDDNGLKITANLANTTTGKDLYELIKRSDIDKMSMAMYVAEDSYDRATNTRTITKISKLGDVSAVDMPAYDQTSISCRSFFETQHEMEQKILKEKEIFRQLLILKTYL